MPINESYPATRLVRLFAVETSDKRAKSPSKSGVTRLAQLLGIDRRVVYRWMIDGPRNTGGHVPTRYTHRILEAADAAGVSREVVAQYLDMDTCPTCGRPYEPGMAGHVHG